MIYDFANILLKKDNNIRYWKKVNFSYKNFTNKITNFNYAKLEKNLNK